MYIARVIRLPSAVGDPDLDRIARPPGAFGLSKGADPGQHAAARSACRLRPVVVLQLGHVHQRHAGPVSNGLVVVLRRGWTLTAAHHGDSVRVHQGAPGTIVGADVLPLGRAAVPGIEPQVADEVLGDAFEVGGHRTKVDRALGAAGACDRVRVLIGAIRIIVVADVLPLGRTAVPGIEPQLADGVRGE